MKLQDGTLVKWIGENGGWCMGHVQTTPRGGFVCRFNGLQTGLAYSDSDTLLVKHTLTGELEFVDADLLERHPPRSEWKSHAEPEVKA